MRRGPASRRARRGPATCVICWKVRSAARRSPPLQPEIGVDHADQRQVGEMIALGHQLRADDDVDVARLHPARRIRRPWRATRSCREVTIAVLRLGQQRRRPRRRCARRRGRRRPAYPRSGIRGRRAGVGIDMAAMVAGAAAGRGGARPSTRCNWGIGSGGRRCGTGSAAHSRGG